jgi:hypothetical protein
MLPRPAPAGAVPGSNRHTGAPLPPKYVASSTLDSVDQWPNSTLIKGSVADFVAELRQQDGGTIGTAGSPSLVRR